MFNYNLQPLYYGLTPKIIKNNLNLHFWISLTQKNYYLRAL